MINSSVDSWLYSWTNRSYQTLFQIIHTHESTDTPLDQTDELTQKPKPGPTQLFLEKMTVSIDSSITTCCPLHAVSITVDPGVVKTSLRLCKAVFTLLSLLFEPVTDEI
jgi:hypothetical protein